VTGVQTCALPILPSHVARGSTSGGHDGTDGLGVMFLGATIGIATVMAVLLVAIVACFVTSSKRRSKSVQHQTKQKRQPPTGGTAAQPISTDFGFPSTTKAGICDNVHLDSYCNVDSAPADPVEARYVSLQRYQSASGGSTIGRKDSTRVNGTTTLMSPKLVASAPPCRQQLVDASPQSPGSGTLKRRAAAHQQRNVCGPSCEESMLGSSLLDRMMTTDVESERPLSMSELPPPPDFLLEGGSTTSTPPQSDVVSGGHSGSMGRRRVLRGPPLLFEVADGYRSGDSVDDDIDDIDPTIRMPSMLVQPY